jgi:hypothetical protein
MDLVKRCAALVAFVALVSCNEGPAPTPSSIPSPETLPAVVEQAKESIVRASRRLDYEALERLAGHKEFRYSFGESNDDPVGYWRRLESEGHVPIFGDTMPAVFATHFGRQNDIYVWPAAAAKDPKEWTARDVEELTHLANEEDIEGYRKYGGYLGWRAGIRGDGTWLYFIAGD